MQQNLWRCVHVFICLLKTMQECGKKTECTHSLFLSYFEMSTVHTRQCKSEVTIELVTTAHVDTVVPVRLLTIELQERSATRKKILCVHLRVKSVSGLALLCC